MIIMSSGMPRLPIEAPPPREAMLRRRPGEVKKPFPRVLRLLRPGRASTVTDPTRRSARRLRRRRRLPPHGHRGRRNRGRTPRSRLRRDESGLQGVFRHPRDGAGLVRRRRSGEQARLRVDSRDARHARPAHELPRTRGVLLDGREAARLVLRSRHHHQQAQRQGHGHHARRGLACRTPRHPRGRRHRPRRGAEHRRPPGRRRREEAQGPEGHEGEHHDPQARARRAPPDDRHARGDPHELRLVRLHARAGRRVHPPEGFHAHVRARASGELGEAREAGHEEARLRPAREPRRPPRPGHRRVGLLPRRRTRKSS